jgi:hypothetical protein
MAAAAVVVVVLLLMPVLVFIAAAAVMVVRGAVGFRSAPRTRTKQDLGTGSFGMNTYVRVQDSGT